MKLKLEPLHLEFRTWSFVAEEETSLNETIFRFLLEFPSEIHSVINVIIYDFFRNLHKHVFVVGDNIA